MNSVKFLKTFVLAICLTVFAASCGDQDEIKPEKYVFFRNYSDEICYIFAYEYDDDTILTVDKVFRDFKADFNQVWINSGIRVALTDDKWYPMLKNNLQIIVIKESTYGKYTEEELAKGNIYDKYYSLAPDEIKALDNIIVYDGE